MGLLKSRIYYVVYKQTELSSSWPGFLIIDGATFYDWTTYTLSLLCQSQFKVLFLSIINTVYVLIQLNQNGVNMYYIICSQSADAFHFESISQCESNVFFHITISEGNNHLDILLRMIKRSTAAHDFNSVSQECFWPVISDLGC